MIITMATYETSILNQKALINSAGELAAKKGFASVSIREIARHAKQNVGSIHYHFGGKGKLFEAVIREVIQIWKDDPITERLKQIDTDTQKGQSQAIRVIIRRNIDLLFNLDVPEWHSKVMFQVMLKKGPLQEIVKKELITPTDMVVAELFKKINPTMDDNETFLRILIMNTPVFFHADRMDPILTELRENKYSKTYLRNMEDIVVLQTQVSLGLPPS